MTLREAAQQALEALDSAQRHNYALKHKETDNLIFALRDALAEATSQESRQVEPVMMTRDDIIRMAREASGGTVWWPVNSEILERFAALVAAHEREACAKVCEEIERKATKQPPMVGQGCQACASAIRARCEK